MKNTEYKVPYVMNFLKNCLIGLVVLYSDNANAFRVNCYADHFVYGKFVGIPQSQISDYRASFMEIYDSESRFLIPKELKVPPDIPKSTIKVIESAYAIKQKIVVTYRKFAYWYYLESAEHLTGKRQILLSAEARYPSYSLSYHTVGSFRNVLVEALTEPQKSTRCGNEKPYVVIQMKDSKIVMQLDTLEKDFLYETVLKALEGNVPINIDYHQLRQREPKLIWRVDPVR